MIHFIHKAHSSENSLIFNYFRGSHAAGSHMTHPLETLDLDKVTKLYKCHQFGRDKEKLLNGKKIRKNMSQLFLYNKYQEKLRCAISLVAN